MAEEEKTVLHSANSSDLMVEQGTKTELPKSVTQQTATEAHGPPDAVQQGPFFTNLNLDVRMTIYDYLYGRLPPLAVKNKAFDKPGMVLSCKQASLVS
jgi:hypothetical protein